MRKMMVTAFLLLSSMAAQAEVRAVFHASGGASVRVQGQDSDAIKLFDAMNVDATLLNGALQKRVYYEVASARAVFEMNCEKDPHSDAAACRILFYSPEADVNKEQRSILVGIDAPSDASTVANQFNSPPVNNSSSEVFKSADGHFRIWKTFDSQNQVSSFTISYRE